MSPSVFVRVPEKIEHSAHIRMSNSLCEVHFPLESLQTVRIPDGDFGTNHFDSYMFVEFQILRLVNFPHSSSGDKLNNAKAFRENIARGLQWAATYGRRLGGSDCWGVEKVHQVCVVRMGEEFTHFLTHRVVGTFNLQELDTLLRSLLACSFKERLCAFPLTRHTPDH